MKGRFITLEGIDGSGKSTQMGMLAATVRERAYDVVTTCEPGGTPLGVALRAAFLETTETVAPMAELLSFAADRAQHVEQLIRPSLAAGKIVISDRYADATFAYQGAGRGFSEDKVKQVIELATDGLRPDLTLFFDIPVETAIVRMAGRDEGHTKRNRMDDETAEFYSRVRDAYLGIAEREPGRFKVVDALGTPVEIHERAANVVLTMLDV
ncbi:MAG: dTMP kinase [Chloracidobacterium sp.]|nr:dTMP kinase [Chloracidobacterium sp.]